MYTEEDIIKKVNDIIVDKLGVKESEVVQTARFFDDLGADSLDQVELVMELESEFGVSISEEQMGNLEIVEDVYKYLFKNLNISTNLANLLYNSIGETFYSTVYGDVKIVLINDQKILIETVNKQTTTSLLSDGRLFEEGECILFPSKENRDWNTYKSKVKFEIGEPVWVKDNTIVFGWTLVPYSKNLEKTHHTIKFDQIKFKGYDINIKIKLIKNNDC